MLPHKQLIWYNQNDTSTPGTNYVFIREACEHPEHLLRNTLATYQLAYNVHTIESKIAFAGHGGRLSLALVESQVKLS